MCVRNYFQHPYPRDMEIMYIKDFIFNKHLIELVHIYILIINVLINIINSNSSVKCYQIIFHLNFLYLSYQNFVHCNYYYRKMYPLLNDYCYCCCCCYLI